MPARDIPSVSLLERIHFDKFVHFGLFGTLVALWTIPYASRHNPDKNTRFFLLVCLAACAFGAGMEWFQLEFTDRDYENGDIVADSIGAITGMVISMAWVRARKAARPSLTGPGRSPERLRAAQTPSGSGAQPRRGCTEGALPPRSQRK